MFIRNVRSQDMIVGGVQWREVNARPNIYNNAFPFDRANAGKPRSTAFVAIHGQNGAVTTTADVWAQGGLRTFPSAAFTIGVSSSSANDVLTSGTGAWTVEVDMLDANYIPHTLTLNLNGQTKVSDTNFVLGAWRINDVRVTAWGTGTSNVGDIYVYDASDTVTAGVPQTATKIFSKILATENTARGGFYTVPAGCAMDSSQIRAAITDTTTTAREVVMNLWFYKWRAAGLPIPNFFPLTGQINGTTGMITIDPNYSVTFDEKWDITFHAAASASVSMAFYMDAVLYYK
jgi:hypothetical protein